MIEKVRQDLKYILDKMLPQHLLDRLDKISDYIFKCYNKVIYFPSLENISENCNTNIEESEFIYNLYRNKLFLMLAGLFNYYVNVDRGQGLQPNLDNYIKQYEND